MNGSQLVVAVNLTTDAGALARWCNQAVRIALIHDRSTYRVTLQASSNVTTITGSTTRYGSTPRRLTNRNTYRRQGPATGLPDLPGSSDLSVVRVTKWKIHCEFCRPKNRVPIPLWSWNRAIPQKTLAYSQPVPAGDRTPMVLSRLPDAGSAAWLNPATPVPSVELCKETGRRWRGEGTWGWKFVDIVSSRKIALSRWKHLSQTATRGSYSLTVRA